MTPLKHSLRVDVHAALEVIRSRAPSSRWIESSCGFRIDLSGADLRNANLAGAWLENAQMMHCRLEMADLSGPTLKGANLSHAKLVGTVTSEAVDLRCVNLSDAWVDNAELPGADLRGADLTQALVFNTNLSQADLSRFEEGGQVRDTKLTFARVDGVNLSGANLSHAILQNTSIKRTTLGRSNLARAVLSGASFDVVDLRCADLRSADWCSKFFGLLHDADLRGVKGLSKWNLSKAIGNSFTLLPAELDGKDAMFVWSHFAKESESADDTPPNIESIVELVQRFVEDAQFREQYGGRRPLLVSEQVRRPTGPTHKLEPRLRLRGEFESELPVKSGTPLDLKKPRPDGHPLGKGTNAF